VRHTVAAPQAGSRLDAFLVAVGAAGTAGSARRLLEGGAVTVDGRAGRKGQRLLAGQTVEIAPGPAAVVIPQPELPLSVLHEDAALVAVDKPAGWPTHPLRAGEGGTLASALVARYPGCASASADPREAGFVHRLDTGTSGVIVAARDPGSWQALRRLFGGEGCEKTYLAQVVAPPGPMDADPEPITVDLAIGRRGRRSPRVELGTGRGLLPARTQLLVRARQGDSWLVEARLHRGRAHQVRAHLHHLGMPVLGDPLYTDPRAAAVAAALGVVGFRLHAWRVQFPHPATGQPLLIQAPLPAWAAHMP
jgi:23S rRNA pseudouridine1911/1915/1917 synthase